MPESTTCTCPLCKREIPCMQHGIYANFECPACHIIGTYYIKARELADAGDGTTVIVTDEHARYVKKARGGATTSGLSVG